MMLRFNLRLIHIFLFFFLSNISSWATNGEQTLKQEYKKTINKLFPIDPIGSVALYNKYGNVNIKTNLVGEVKIDVTISVNAKDQKNADELFEKIKIHFKADPQFVSAETEIDNSRKKLWGGSDNGNNDFTINYEVQMPSSCMLDLKNRYGNATVESLDNNMDAEIKYGDIICQNIGNKLTLELGYGYGSVDGAMVILADISYSKFKMKEASEVRLDTKYSKTYIDKAKILIIDSAYDGFFLGEIGHLNNEGKYDNFKIDFLKSLTTTTKYTDFEIKTLGEYVVGDFSYGGLEVDNLLSSIERINLDGNYTSFKFGVDDKLPYSLDAVGHYSGISVPDGFVVTYEKESGSDKNIKGYNRHAKNATMISVRLNYGSLKIWE